MESLTDIKGVGESLAKKLASVRIKSTSDLIDYYPRRYEDYSDIKPISSISPGIVTIKAKIIQANGRYVRRGMHLTEAIASDSSGSVRLIWFNQPYRAKSLSIGGEYYISGNYELSRSRYSIMNPSAELVKNFPVNTARIIPIYPENRNIKSTQIRKIIASIKDDILATPESLPQDVIEENNLMSKNQALLQIHFPNTIKELERARHRIAFEEVFSLILASLINKEENMRTKSVALKFDEKLIKEFVNTLPYKLTDAQRKVAWQIFQDLESDVPANRLIEGDVGSGKTIVAAMVCLLAIKKGYKAAIMAPTEILARQHYQSFSELFERVGIKKDISLLLGSMKPSEKASLHKKIKDGSTKLIIGTHSLIAEKVDIPALAVVIIDEQHRFGVDQRKALLKKTEKMPHLISMTATPIPRSLALTVYGELDVSVIDQMPPGRKPVITKIIPPSSKMKLYKDIDNLIDQGRQMFVVCPLIEESLKLNFLSAEEVYRELSTKVFKHRCVELMHGKLKTEEKTKIMNDFTNGKVDVLVSTTVIEVGVNIPNASVMLIEGVERFGLAQVHQLRGRIGRGEHQGYCYLLMSDSKAPSQRLRALESTSDGFKLAELDLKLRGPGAIYGAMQHGELDLRMADISDVKLIAAARTSAQKLLKNNFNPKEHPYLMKEVKHNRTVVSLN